MKKIHRNSHKNNEKHHLYIIKDKIGDDVVKYGISADAIEDDGLSNRVRRQLRIYNALVGWKRFYAVIAVKGIKGRKLAEELETHYIKMYREKHGKNPRNNLK